MPIDPIDDEADNGKSSLFAALLSFIIPGAGLWYLGRWFWGYVNLAAALTVGALFVNASDSDLLKGVRGMILFCGTPSAIGAYVVALRAKRSGG